MGKQLERFVKAVVGDILKQDYPYLTSPAILLARVSAVKTLSDTYEAEELDIHNDEGGTSYRGHIVGRWQEYTLTVVDRFGSEDSSFPALPGVRSQDTAPGRGTGGHRAPLWRSHAGHHRGGGPVTGLHDTDIRLDEDGQLTQAADGDAPLCSGMDCFLQSIILEAQTQKGELFYDEDFGWSLYDFLQSEDDEITRLEITQRVRSGLLKREEIIPDSVQVKWGL